MSETFGQRLKRLREAKGWTVIELAYKWHQDISVVNDWESGERKMFICEPMLDLAKLFGATMDYLYTGVQPSSWANTPGKRIRLRRDELGWGVDDLVASSGHQIHYVLSAESDDLNDFSHLGPNIPSALGVTPEWILTGAEPKFTVVENKFKRAEYMVRFLRTMVSEHEMSQTETVEVSVVVAKGFGKKLLEMIGTGRPIE